MMSSSDRQILIVAANRPEAGFCAAVTNRVLEVLRRRNRAVVLHDLYAMGFDPVLSEAEREGYFAGLDGSDPRAAAIEALRRSDCLVLIYPTWWFGMPAILKGYFDRLFVPGVAFDLGADGTMRQHGLSNVRRLIVITSYGFPRWYVRWIARDPGKTFILRGLRPIFSRGCAVDWLALHGMDKADMAERTRFLDRVEALVGRI
jgi:putative NADPH-quinone reductase